MNEFPVANVIVVLTAMIATVSRSSPDTGRPVACRHPIAPVIQTSAQIIAVARLKSTRLVAKRTAGAITAVARLIATRVTMSRTWGGSGRSAAVGPRAASRVVTLTLRPAPGHAGRMSRRTPKRQSGRLVRVEVFGSARVRVESARRGGFREDRQILDADPGARRRGQPASAAWWISVRRMMRQ